MEATLIIHTQSRLVKVLSNACMVYRRGGLQYFIFVSFTTNLLMKQPEEIFTILLLHSPSLSFILQNHVMLYVEFSCSTASYRQRFNARFSYKCRLPTAMTLNLQHFLPLQIRSKYLEACHIIYLSAHRFRALMFLINLLKPVLEASNQVHNVQILPRTRHAPRSNPSHLSRIRHAQRSYVVRTCKSASSR